MEKPDEIVCPHCHKIQKRRGQTTCIFDLHCGKPLPPDGEIGCFQDETDPPGEVVQIPLPLTPTIH